VKSDFELNDKPTHKASWNDDSCGEKEMNEKSSSTAKVTEIHI